MTRTVWVTTCDLCEKTTIEHDGDLTEQELGEKLLEAGWQLPVYGGTIEPKCWAAMRKLNAR